jgi:peptidyl-tRNA hydrolase
MENSKKIRIIAGLGNEGSDYQRTYHNVGSFGVRYFSDLYKKDYPSLTFSSDLGGFMNTIGIPVQKLIKMKGASPAECLIVHDESDLSVGEYKLSFGGGSAGHKGVQSVLGALGSDGGDFWRLRIGVRDPSEQARKKAEEFVLNKWSKSDEEEFKKALDSAWEEIKTKGLV